MADETLVNLGGNPKLNINTTTAKGLEKAIGVIARFVIRAQSKVNRVIYGSKRKNNPNASKNQNALSKGILFVLRELSKVDFCNFL